MFKAVIKVSSKEDLQNLIKNHPVFFAVLPNSSAPDSKRLLTNVEEFAKKNPTYPFVILDESMRGHFQPHFNPKAPVAYYIFRNGYMLFRRDYEIWFEDVERALQFASAIDMKAWLAEEPRFQLQ